MGRWGMLLCLFLALGTLAPAQNLSSDQSRAIQKVLDFYQKMGDTKAAERLQDGLSKGTIKFGPCQGNANANCDMRSKDIAINPGCVESVNSPTLESWRATANLAATISHEMVHQNQDSWSWTSSYWKEQAGFGNPCEQEAWGGTFQKMAAWVQKTKAELDSKTNKSVREQAEVAQRLQMLCNAFQVLRNDYQAEKGNIGDLGLKDADGLSLSLESLASQVADINDLAGKVIGNANVIVQPFDGNYRGTFSGKGSGRIAFKIQGFTVSGRILGTYQGDPCSGSVAGRVDADGNLSLELSGAVTYDKNTYPFEGSLTGHVWKGQASGKWYAHSKGYGDPVGSWSASK